MEIDFTIKNLQPLERYKDCSINRANRHAQLQRELIRLFQELRMRPSQMEWTLQSIRDHIIRNEKELDAFHYEKYPPYST